MKPVLLITCNDWCHGSLQCKSNKSKHTSSSCRVVSETYQSLHRCLRYHHRHPLHCRRLRDLTVLDWHCRTAHCRCWSCRPRCECRTPAPSGPRPRSHSSLPPPSPPSSPHSPRHPHPAGLERVIASFLQSLVRDQTKQNISDAWLFDHCKLLVQLWICFVQTM